MQKTSFVRASWYPSIIKTHLRVFIINLFLFLNFTLFVLEPALATTEYLFKGNINVASSSFTIFDEYTQQEYKIFTRTRSIFQTIIQLESGDYISGAAFIDPEGKLLVTSIDFVGLKRLLGVWSDKHHVMNFDSINTMNFWNFEKGLIWKYWGPFGYAYSITPDDEGKWKVFFSDDKNVMLALLHCIDKNHITISIYNSNDGSIDKVYELEKP
jgi:hypothetical protein